MHLRYEKYLYLYPPRPEKAIPPDGFGSVPDLSTYERMGYSAQIKKNGTCNVIAVAPSKRITTIPMVAAIELRKPVKAPSRSSIRHEQITRQLICMPRHGPAHPHRGWSPNANAGHIFKRLPGDDWYVFAAELLHAKTPHIKHTNYVYDILVDNGEYLIGTTFAERQARLYEILLNLAIGNPADFVSHFVIDENLWLAKSHPAGSDFRSLYKRLEKSEDEGLVLKNPNARLELCYREQANRDWQVKCRKEHKNFSF